MRAPPGFMEAGMMTGRVFMRYGFHKNASSFVRKYCFAEGAKLHGN